FTPSQTESRGASQPRNAAGSSAQKTPAPLSLPTAERTLTFENKNIIAVFTANGGAIKNYELKENGKGKNVNMVAPGGVLFATLSDSPARLTKRGATVTSEQNIGGAHALRKIYRFDENGLAEFSISLDSSGSLASAGKRRGRDTSGAKLRSVDMIFSSGIGDDKADAKELADGNAVKYLVGKKTIRVKSGGASLDGAKWLAADSRYFILAVAPTAADGFTSEKLEVSAKTRAAPPVAILSISFNPGAVEKTYKVVAGGKAYSQLRRSGMGLEKSLDFGFLGGLGKFFLEALIAINKVTKNYGWAIVILSLGIQAVTLPLSLKSLKATADMKRLQPLMREIQTKYKDDPKRMNVEVMNLYKTHRVNPMSGCLPMLLQMPIFWALFTTLKNAYELRGADWIFWIKDLSAADTLFSDLFRLPFTLGLLPLLMGAGMFAQQMMSGATSDPQNKMMGYIFPVVFTFMFLKFPSGVVLYWLINSILTITIQLFFLEKEIIKEHKEAIVTVVKK
ncbi:MAG: YidC/Oxa1 family insertase periplasmic-domain containing protein, partial [Endomicrobiia bacterium]|nr:YidC/Oxa1 family insertase periplasmic-domain containing protein [Endomicrobiia bacterium]